MSDVVITPLMGLSNPVPGADPGPDYATNLYNSLNIVDSHNHSAGSGNQINTAGILINADLPLNGYNATQVRSVRFTAQGSPISGATDLGCLYEAGVDLYYNDGNGNKIRITSGGTVNATSSGISSGTASASFSGGVLVVDSATNTPGNIQAGSILIGNNVTSSNFVTVSAPNALAANYTVTLPSATPATSGAGLAMDTSGNVSTVVGGLIPTGTLLPFGGASAPGGYLLCDGSAVSRSTYSALFAVIGTSFGSGNGTTTFNVPNMARSVPMGAGGSASGTIGNAVGNTGGEENHTLSVGEMNHQHTLPVGNSGKNLLLGMSADNAWNYGNAGATTNIAVSNASWTSYTTGGVQLAYTSAPNSSSATGHNTIQPSVIVNYIIKT